MKIALFYFSSCYSAHARQGYQDGTLALFWEMTPCSLAPYVVLARVFPSSCLWRNNWLAAIHCVPCEISLLHTHLQCAHLLIRSDPGDWLALLFRGIEICLSFLLNRQTRIGIDTSRAHLRTHTCAHAAQTHVFIMPLLRLIGGLLCDVDVGQTQHNPSSSPLWLPDISLFFIRDRGIEGSRHRSNGSKMTCK